MRLRTGSVVLAVAALALTGAAHAASFEIREAAVRVTVIPEARHDVAVEIVSANPRLPLKVTRGRDGKAIVDGRLGRRIRGCLRDGPLRIDIAGAGPVAYADLPRVVIRSPMDVRAAAGGAVFGEVGRSTSLTLVNAGCGDWTLANAAGELRLTQAGDGGVRAGAAGVASLRIAGAGDIHARRVLGPLEAEVAGAGDVLIDELDGPLTARIAGSGNVRVAGGRASSMNAAVTGSGDATFGGQAGSLTAQVTGSGDVRARAVTGPVTRRVLGSGRVLIGP